MSSPTSNGAPRPVGQLALFLGLVLLAAFVLFFIMRAVTPMKDRDTTLVLPTPTTTPYDTVSSTVPSPNDPGRMPDQDGKTDTTSSTSVGGSDSLGMHCDATHSICVSIPLANDLVGNPTMVTGTAIAFENVFSWELKDAEGNSLAGGHSMADAPDVGQPGPFSIRAFWDASPRTSTGTLMVYEASARDGSPIHVVQVPVRFAKQAEVKRALYFVPDLSKNTDCSDVKAVQIALPATLVPIEATLRALLRVESSETPVGLKTSIPDRTNLVSFSLTNGVAKAVFDAGLERDGGGSCRVGAIRAQITKTLMQFPSVQRVDISVQGKTPEETLQP